MRRGELLRKLEQGGLPEYLEPVYGKDAPSAAYRLRELVLEYGETFPGGNPGPAECRRSRPRGLPGYPYRLLKRCGRLHTPSRTGAARFLLAAFFQRRIVSATFNRQEWLWIPTKRPSKARRASIAC